MLGVVATVALLAGSCAVDDPAEGGMSTGVPGETSAGSSTSSVADTPRTPVVSHDPNEFRDPDVPDLPFDDNPDPDQCGIPTVWGPGGEAWLTGIWDGELIEPEVFLYDSHQRLSISGRGDHGAEVEIVLYQGNPVLDFYMVEVVGTGESGWVPAPFLSFELVVMSAG